jgi:hypothetical protein
MSMNHRSRSLVFGFATVFAFTLLAPAAVTAQEEAAVLAPVAAPSVDETSADEVRAIRAVAAERALLTGDIGSMQEEHLVAIVAAAPSWDETSGYDAVEASRASIGHPAASTTQVPADVRWAPAGVIAPESSIEARGGANRDYLPAALASGTRTESAHLATVALPNEAVRVNPSDDRIAAALFADEPRGEDAAVAIPHRTQR